MKATNLKTQIKSEQTRRSKNLPRSVNSQTILEQRELNPLPQGKTYVMSVDPGREGCASLLRIEDQKIMWNCPYEDKDVLRKMILHRRDDTIFVMEDPTKAVRNISGHGNPQTIFRFGKNTGWFEGAVHIATGTYPIRLSPQLWMKAAGLIGFPKEEVCKRLRILYGQDLDLKRTSRCTTDWIDYAESIMIGLAYLDMTSDYMICYL